MPVSVGFHVHAGAVARVAADKQLAAAHRIACRVADGTVDDDAAVVGGVSYGVLRVAADDDFSSVEIRAERVAGRAVNFERSRFARGADKALTDTVFDDGMYASACPNLFV